MECLILKLGSVDSDKIHNLRHIKSNNLRSFSKYSKYSEYSEYTVQWSILIGNQNYATMWLRNSNW